MADKAIAIAPIALNGKILTLEEAEELKTEAFEEWENTSSETEKLVRALNKTTNQHGLLDVLLHTEFDSFADELGKANRKRCEAYNRYQMLYDICEKLEHKKMAISNRCY